MVKHRIRCLLCGSTRPEASFFPAHRVDIWYATSEGRGKIKNHVETLEGPARARMLRFFEGRLQACLRRVDEELAAFDPLRHWTPPVQLFQLRRDDFDILGGGFLTPSGQLKQELLRRLRVELANAGGPAERHLVVLDWRQRAGELEAKVMMVRHLLSFSESP